MVEKGLIEVYVPVLQRAFDIFIPLELPMYETIELIKKAVRELSDGRFQPDGSTVLCHYADGRILDINLSAIELEIHHGSKLMLI